MHPSTTASPIGFTAEWAYWPRPLFISMCRKRSVARSRAFSCFGYTASTWCLVPLRPRQARQRVPRRRTRSAPMSADKGHLLRKQEGTQLILDLLSDRRRIFAQPYRDLKETFVECAP